MLYLLRKVAAVSVLGMLFLICMVTFRMGVIEGKQLSGPEPNTVLLWFVAVIVACREFEPKEESKG